MVLYFKVRNYRSIKDEIILDFRAGASEDLTQFPGYFVNDNKERILKGIGILGNNASGKTNVLSAFRALSTVILSSVNFTEEQHFPFIVPFAFDEKTVQNPTDFALLFEMNGIKYLYSLALTKEEIVKESLSFAPKGRMVSLFEREGKTMKFHSAYVTEENGKLISQRILKNKPVVTFAAQFNIPYLMDVYTMMAQNILYTDSSGNPNEQGIGTRLEHDPGYRKFLKSLLVASDLNIDDVSMTKEKAKVLLPLNQDGAGMMGYVNQEIYHISTSHKIGGKEHALSLHEESLGTKKMMAQSGAVYDALMRGSFLIFDEFGSSFHPLLSSFLLSLFFDDTTNPRHAQVLFNTQETYLLKEKLLRRDEIYMTEKNPETGITELSSLKDYSVRKKEDIENGYLMGRYTSGPNLDAGKVDLK